MSAVDPEESCLRTLGAWKTGFFCDFSSSQLLFPTAVVVGVDMGVLFAGVEPVGVDMGTVGVDVGAVGVNVGAVGVNVGTVGVDREGSCSREMAVGLNEVAPFSKLLDLGILVRTGFTI